MKYVQIQNPGPDSHLVLVEGTMPQCKESELLIKVHATALNRADLLQRQGKYPPPAGESGVPGLEVAGEVVAVGNKVERFNIGDMIYALVGSGGYAEYCLVSEDLAAPIPKNWDIKSAAALPEALTTAYATLFDEGQLCAGQTVLIHGAGSGIASLAIQMAHLSQAQVISTVGHESKIAAAQKLGSSLVIQYNKQSFEELIKEQSIDLIVDFIGGDYFNKHLRLLKPKGRLIQIASMKGSMVECNLALVMRKRLHIIGFVLRSQSLEEKSRLWRLAHERWSTALNSRVLAPIVDSVFPLDQINQAQEYMQSGMHFGKIVITT